MERRVFRWVRWWVVLVVRVGRRVERRGRRNLDGEGEEGFSEGVAEEGSAEEGGEVEGGGREVGFSEGGEEGGVSEVSAIGAGDVGFDVIESMAVVVEECLLERESGRYRFGEECWDGSL